MVFSAAANRKEAADFINAISRGLTTGDEINSMGISGVINAANVTRKKSILATGTFERYPINPNTKVEENVPLSRFDGKRSNVFESDRMTGAFIADDEGNKLFNFFGGIFYPVITGKWWASNTMTKASGIARNSKRDADGYIYGTPIIMKPGSQMSNNDMLLATLELMKMDALKKNSGVTKAELMLYIEKAFDKKKIADKKNIIKNALKRSNNIEQIFNELEYTLFQEEGFIKDRNGNDILNDNGQRIKSLTFEERKDFVSGVLGDRKVVSDKFPSAGSMSAMAEKFTEPETQKSKNVHDIVIVYRTKGDLVSKKSNKQDPFYHKSYPYEIEPVNKDGSSAEIEVFILDGAYNLSEAIKELTKSSGDTFSYEEYYKKVEQGRYKSEKVALAQYGRTAKLSYASGEISARKKQLIQRTDKASEKLQQLFQRENMPLTIQEAKEIVGEVVDWTTWYDGLSTYVDGIFGEYAEDVLSLLPLASMAANSVTTVSLAISNAERIYQGEMPKGVAEYYGYISDFLQGKGIKSDKMSNFFKALTGDKDAIAVDSHVWSIIMWKNPNKKQVNPKNQTEFEKAKEFVRTIADELGLSPREVQAALWAANILRTGERPDSYEEYFKKQLDAKGLKQRIETWRNKGYQPFSEVRKEREAGQTTTRKKQLINKELSKASGTTQVATTTGSYAKVATSLKNKRITGDVLDYGAGLGLGTDAMSDVLNRNVDSFEINTERWKGRRKPTYTNAEDIDKKYEAVVSLNVINVVPKDIRDFIIEDIFSKLKNGGVAYVSSRGFSGDIANAKNFELGPEDKSYIIKRSQGGKNIDVFQKGFDGDELVEYVQDLLGDKAVVEKDNSFGNKGVIITKIKEDGTKLAPNGKPSNLTDKQWEQVRTPNFKSWFGFWDLVVNNLSKSYDNEDVRNTSKAIKNGDKDAINKAAKFLAKQVGKDDILIPMPSRTGKATDSHSLMLKLFQKYQDQKYMMD